MEQEMKFLLLFCRHIIAAQAVSCKLRYLKDRGLYLSFPLFNGDFEGNIALSLTTGYVEKLEISPGPAYEYDDVALDVRNEVNQRLELAHGLGVPRWNLISDPGIGFGKSQAQQLDLINRLDLLKSLHYPILFGASRKGFIGNIGWTPGHRTSRGYSCSQCGSHRPRCGYPPRARCRCGCQSRYNCRCHMPR